ncbi:Lysine--tRNA ligase cytoplasmic [Bienertia sinuspersici]
MDPQKAAGINPLPNFEALMTIAEYTDKYGELNNGEYLEDVPISLAGKITNKRSSSSKLVFYDLNDGDSEVQVVADARKSELEKAEFTKLHSSVTLNNIIGVTGFPGKTQRGVLSIFSKSFTVLSPHHLHELGVDYLAKLVTDCLNIQEATKPEFEPPLSTLSSFRVVVVGDIHEDWVLEHDSKALHFLNPDLVLFTGDFGNENVELVKGIAELNIPKGAILGNHDSWSTSKFSSKVKDGVRAQLECLGEAHVGYGHLNFPSLKLSVVGGRPFSCGGDNLFRKKLIKARYGVRDMEESAEQIYKAALQTPNENSIILLSHNGPKGLGSGNDDICGIDWGSEGGDFGDPDLAQAMLQLRETTNYSIPLVVFGHMHKELANGGSRKMIAMDANNTMYLNAAIVPRVKPSAGGLTRAFTVVEFSDGKITKVAETWVLVNDDKASIEEEHLLFNSNYI